jgi:hypothetical protein
MQNQENCKATEELAKQLVEWRKTHKAPARIPAEIWGRAAELAAHQGVNKIAKALRLDYMSLKRRVGTPLPAGEATFLEWFAPLAGNIGECTLKVKAVRGTRLRIDMKNVSPSSLASLIRDFAG